MKTYKIKEEIKSAINEVWSEMAGQILNKENITIDLNSDIRIMDGDGSEACRVKLARVVTEFMETFWEFPVECNNVADKLEKQAKRIRACVKRNHPKLPNV